jgi:uridine kinase
VYIIGVAGGSGSGKTTFAEKVIHKVGKENITLLHMDSYYLHEQPEEHFSSDGNPNFDHPKAFDWQLLRTHLLQLKSGQPIDIPVYDFKTSSRLNQTEEIKPAKVVIFEGIFSLFDSEIRNILDIMVFLHVDADIRFTRRLSRDINERGRSLESVTKQYYETVRPMYQKFLDPQKQFADFIVGEESEISASILAAKIRELCNDSEFNVDLIRKKFDYEEHKMNVAND